MARRDRGRGETGHGLNKVAHPSHRVTPLGRDIARQHHGCSHFHTSGRADVHNSDRAHVYTSDRPRIVHSLLTDTLPGSVMAEMSGTTTSMPVKQALSPGLADSTAWWRMMTSMVRGRLPAGTWEEGGGEAIEVGGREGVIRQHECKGVYVGGGTVRTSVPSTSTLTPSDFRPLRPQVPVHLLGVLLDLDPLPVHKLALLLDQGERFPVAQGRRVRKGSGFTVGEGLSSLFGGLGQCGGVKSPTCPPVHPLRSNLLKLLQVGLLQLSAPPLPLPCPPPHLFPQVALLQMSGVVYLNCCSTSVMTVKQESHLKVP